MPVITENIDQINPPELLKRPNCYHYFADTSMSLKFVLQPNNLHRVFVRPVGQAMDPNALVDTFMICFAETPIHDIPEVFERVFARFPRSIDLYNSLLGYPWKQDADTKEFVARRTNFGVLIARYRIPGNMVWSPFASIPAVNGEPPRWNTSVLARAVHNGQFDSITLVSRNTDSVSDEDTVRIAAGGSDLARVLVEQDFYKSWKVERQGRLVIAEGIVDSQAVKRVDRYEVEVAYL